jgi:hypothetical protein
MAADREKVTTPEFRVSFPNVFRAASYDGGEPKFNVSMIFSKKADLAAMKAIAKAAVKAKWGDKPPSNLKNPFRDGTEKEHLDGYGPDTIFVGASTKSRPGLVDKSLNPIIEEDEFYAGCYARATISAFCYDVKGNKGVSFGLHNIQKLRDGESFSGRVAAEEDFDKVDDGAWDDDGEKVEAGDDDGFLD